MNFTFVSLDNKTGALKLIDRRDSTGSDDVNTASFLKFRQTMTEQNFIEVDLEETFQVPIGSRLTVAADRSIRAND